MLMCMHDDDTYNWQHHRLFDAILDSVEQALEYMGYRIPEGSSVDEFTRDGAEELAHIVLCGVRDEKDMDVHIELCECCLAGLDLL